MALKTPSSNHQVTEVQYVNIKPLLCKTHGAKVSLHSRLDSVHFNTSEQIATDKCTLSVILLI